MRVREREGEGGRGEREREGEREKGATDLWSYDKVLHSLHDILVPCDDQL